LLCLFDFDKAKFVSRHDPNFGQRFKNICSAGQGKVIQPITLWLERLYYFIRLKTLNLLKWGEEKKREYYN